MKIIAIDTSAKVLSVALCNDRQLKAETTLNTGNTHSETLLTVTEELCNKAEWSIGDVDIFACSNGPGSFTGVRIGVSFIKGLAFGSGKPCIGVSTLEALAYNLSDRVGVISPVMDARRSQLYNALFVSDGKTVRRLCEDRLISAEELKNDISAINDNVYFCGDGSYIAYEATKTPNVMNTGTRSIYQSGYSVAMLALDKYERGDLSSDKTLLPVYLRASQAERELSERLKSEGSET